MAAEVALAALPVRRESVYTPSSCNLYLKKTFEIFYFEQVKSNK
jgi:hypothetical protein